MKVLYLITLAGRGGAQIHLADLIEGFGTSVEAVIATGERGYLWAEGQRLGVPVHHLRHLVHPMRPFADSAAVWETVRLIRQVKPDLIHAHTSKAGMIGRIAGLLTGTPVVFTAHTWSFADGFPSFQRRISILLERVAAWTGGPILNVSEANRRSALDAGIDPGTLHTVWNGIPDAPARSTPRAAGHTRLIMAARFAGQKDQELLVRSLAKAPGDWTLTFAGDGPTRKKAEALTRSLSLADRVVFAGESDRVAELLADADVFVLSTKWEGLPLCILEAMRAGLPVIASDVGGVREAVSDGVTGLVVPAGDEYSLAAAITRLVGNPQLRAQFGAAGRLRYEKDFTIPKMLMRTMKLYKLALSNNPVQAVFDSADAEGRV